MDLDEFVDAACAELGLPRSIVNTTMVLDLAKVVAHNVVRPAAPISAYLLGLAVGAGGDVHELTSRLKSLAATDGGGQYGGIPRGGAARRADNGRSEREGDRSLA